MNAEEVKKFNEGVKEGRYGLLQEMSDYAYRLYERAMYNIFVFLDSTTSDITLGTLAASGDGYEAVARLCAITHLKQRGQEANEANIAAEMKEFANANRKRFAKYNPDFVVKPKPAAWEQQPEETPV